MIRVLNGIAACIVSMVVFGGTARAQDRLVPAGTLLQCVMDELNFSGATAAVGDPVLCQLRTLEEFSRPVFPKGAMLGGHLEDAKGPCHFSGKGYVNLTFDRMILPYGNLPIPAKVIQPRGCKIQKSGDGNGKAQALKHGAQWLMPLPQPEGLSLPMRDRRTRAKGEEQVQLRIMEDILIPARFVYGPMMLDRGPYRGSAQPSVSSDSPGKSALGLTMLVLKSDQVYAISSFRLDGSVLKFADANGAAGVVDANEIDWLRTGEMTSAARSTFIASAARAH